MSTQIAARHGHVISLPNAEIDPTGLRIRQGTDEKGLQQIAERLTQLGTGYQWWLGDMVMYAQHNFKEPDVFIKSLEEMTGLRRNYITFLGNIARMFTHRERLPLPFEHYIAIRHIKSRAKRLSILKKALSRGWSAARLRRRYPKRQYTARIIFRVPPRLVRDARFLKTCKNLCVQFGISFYVAGTVRKAAAKSPHKRTAILD